MNPIKSLFFIVFTCLISFTSFSQTKQVDETLSLYKGTIDNQFEYILKKSGNFKGTNGKALSTISLNIFLKNLVILKVQTVKLMKL